MSRKNRRQAIGVALFPFLAVLICTMGALIVLLVLLVQQARLDAREVAQNKQPVEVVDPLAAERKAAQEKIEDEQWRQSILEQQRAEQVEELAASRLKVAHLEDHIRRLQEQARILMARAREIDEGKQSASPSLAAEQEELAKLQAEIARRKAELDEKKKKLAEKEQSYALLPYDGPNGTKRRPIYIECRVEGVVLQPEGLILGPEDFSGPMNPGNPLDAALRTIRETWKRNGEPGEPYPLLVVRPSGIFAYQAARQALRGWDDEFGYELVSDSKKLDFGAPNPAMQRILEDIVGRARERQVMLAAAMPRKFQDDDTITSFAAEDQRDYQEAVAAARGAGGVNNGNGELAGGFGPRGSAAGGFGPGGGPGGGTGSGSFGSGGTGQGTGGFGSPAGGYAGGTNGQFAASGNAGYPAGQGGTGPGGTGPGGYGGQTANGQSAAGQGANGQYAAGSPGGTATAGGSAGGAPGGNGGSNGQYGSGQAGSSGLSSGQPGSGQSGASSGQMSGAGQGSSGQSGGSSGGASGGPTGATSSGAQATATKSRGSARSGSNWGLPGSQGRTTAVTRPIRVVCLPDRLVVVPERGDDRAAAVIPISPNVQPAEIENFVRAVQLRLDSWGPAMTNGYWKPVLQVEVSRAAEPQFETLQQMLSGSGFELQRKTP
jgi:hypothetical protein